MMKIIKENTRQSKTQPLNEAQGNVIASILCRLIAGYLVRRAPEGKNYKSFLESMKSATTDQQKLSVVDNFLFDLGGLYEELDLFFIDNLAELGLELDESKISAYAVKIFQSSIK